MVLAPGAVERFAHTYITSLYVPPEKRGVTVDIVRRFPSVSVIDIGAILDQVRRAMDRAALAVQYVFLFTLAAGITVLLAAIQATRDERMFESAVLRTLGARRGVVLQGVAAEFLAEDALVHAVHEGATFLEELQDVGAGPLGMLADLLQDFVEHLLAVLHALADLELAEVVAQLAGGLIDLVEHRPLQGDARELLEDGADDLHAHPQLVGDLAEAGRFLLGWHG
jgi:hypothetical protein